MDIAYTLWNAIRVAAKCWELAAVISAMCICLVFLSGCGMYVYSLPEDGGQIILSKTVANRTYDNRMSKKEDDYERLNR